jgi:hypothetical protein
MASLFGEKTVVARLVPGYLNPTLTRDIAVFQSPPSPTLSIRFDLECRSCRYVSDLTELMVIGVINSMFYQSLD